MAQSTNEIRQRIRGIGNIKQITNAMELVSTVKMRRSREQMEEMRPYYRTVRNNISDVLGNPSVKHPLLEDREEGKSLYIVMAGDRGLAGGYNTQVCRLVDTKFQDRKDDICLITVGNTTYDFFKTRGYNIIDSYRGISEDPMFEDAKSIGEYATNLMIDNEVSSINVVYTEFISSIESEPKMIKLLPTDKLSKTKDGSKATEVIEFEPSPERVLDYLIPKYVEGSIYGALIEAAASEQSARRMAMKSATDNAEEMIDDLEMSYNRARQAAITMEITEIVSGADALK